MKWIKLGDSIINMNRFYSIKIIDHWRSNIQISCIFRTI
jgi:hypothetical protein